LLSFYAELQVVNETTCMALKAKGRNRPDYREPYCDWYAAAMRVWGVLAAAGIVSGLASCDAPAQVAAGEDCNSLNECKAGLTCIEGVCDADLTTIAGQVPLYADAAVATGGGTGGAAAVASGGAVTGGDAGAVTGGAAPADAGAR
jgi:hypothetical protein